MLERCLAVDRAGRYGTWVEVEAALPDAYATVAGRPAPSPETSQGLDREERVAAGWSYSELGNSYLDLGRAADAIPYFERAVAAAGRERRLEGAGLGNLGNAYADVGDARRAIGCYEQALAIDREIGDRQGQADDCWNLGLLYEQQGDLARAVELMQVSVDFERATGHPNAGKDAARAAQIRARIR